MAKTPPNNPLVCRVALIMSRDQRETVNVFHVAKSTGWNETTMLALANAFKAWFQVWYAFSLTSNVSLNNIQVRLLDPSNPLAVDLPLVPPVPGQRGIASEAANVTLSLSERTGKAGRAYRGRFYAASIAEQDVDQTDVMTSVAVSRWGGVIDNLIQDIVAAAAQLVIFHTPHLLPHPLDNTYTPVISWVVENIIDSMRRRLPGRGR